jgi:hypothetical protein
VAATYEEIVTWLREARSIGATHMIVKHDTLETDPTCCCYPVYVLPGENARKKADELGDQTMECYSMALPDAMQLTERRAFHWE